MATVKNFGLAGVGDKIQMGKGGGHLDYGNIVTTGGGQLSAVDEAGTALDFFNVLDPTTDTNAATKLYVDSVATGLDVKNSVRVATITELAGGTYTAGLSEGQGTWAVTTGQVVDGVTLANGNRVLVKDEAEGTDQEGQGIWVYDGTTGYVRATDADNTPDNEVSGGMFTFVEEGDVNAEQGFVMISPNGIAIVDTGSADRLLFSQFSGAASFDAGVGLTQTGNTVDLDIGTLADTTIDILDSIAFEDQSGGVDAKRSWTNILTDLDILTDAAGGNALLASDGIDLTGNTLTLDINGLTLNTVISGSDNLAIYDGANTRKITISELLADVQGDRIEDPLDSDNFVDTDATTDSVTIGVKNFADSDSLAIAEFKHGAADGDCGFIFTNGADEVRIETQGENDCDIRLVPGGTGSVLIGDSGAATIQGDDETDLTVKGGDGAGGADAGDLILEGGDGSGAFADGSVIIRPGTGGNTLESVCIQDEDEENVACFFGTAGTDLNSFSFTSSITAVDPTFGVVGEANVGLDIFTQGTGRISLDGNEFPTSTSAASSVFVIGDSAGEAGDVSAVTATTGGATKQFLQFDDGNSDTFSWESFDDILADFDVPNGITVNGFVVLTTDDTYASRTIVADTDAGFQGIKVDSGDGVAGNPEIGLDITNLSLNTVLAGSDELVLFDGTNNVKVTVDSFSSAGDQNLWLSFDADSPGPISANTTTDTFTFTGGTGISTEISGDTVIITNTAPNVENADQNLWSQIDADSGTTTADSETDTLFILSDSSAGLEGIATSIASDTVSIGLNIVGLVADNVASVALNDGGGSYAAANTVTLSGGTGTFATITVDTVNGSGTITAFTLLTTGSYTVDPTPLIANPVTGGDGSAATFDITMNGVSGSDNLVIYDGVNNRKITIDELFADTADSTRITDGANTFVDTDEVAGKVTINTDDGTGGSGTQLLATFSAATSSSTVTDANFLFTNEDAVDTGGNDEIQICAAGDEANIDVRIKPKGTGEVILGDSAANATLSASDGDAGFDLTLNAGDGSVTTGGDITLQPGAGNTTDGQVCINDGEGDKVMCFTGAATAVNAISLVNAATGSAPTFSIIDADAAADTDVDIVFLPNGTGVLSVSGTTDYEDNVTDDDDIPNKVFVNTVLFDTLDDTALGTGTNTLPLNADITRCVVSVTSVYAANVSIDLGTADTPTRITDDDADGFVDWQTVGIYIIEVFESVSLAASLFAIAKTGDAGTGAATIRFEYANA